MATLEAVADGVGTRDVLNPRVTLVLNFPPRRGLSQTGGDHSGGKQCCQQFSAHDESFLHLFYDTSFYNSFLLAGATPPDGVIFLHDEVFPLTEDEFLTPRRW